MVSECSSKPRASRPVAISPTKLTWLELDDGQSIFPFQNLSSRRPLGQVLSQCFHFCLSNWSHSCKMPGKPEKQLVLSFASFISSSISKTDAFVLFFHHILQTDDAVAPYTCFLETAQYSALLVSAYRGLALTALGDALDEQMYSFFMRDIRQWTQG